MSNYMQEAFAPAEAEYRNRVIHATWGHLAPEPRKKYRGYVLFTFGEYGDITVIKDNFEGLPDSPWFYEHVHEFASRKVKTRGRVYRFDGTYMMLKNGNSRFSGKVRVVL